MAEPAPEVFRGLYLHVGQPDSTQCVVCWRKLSGRRHAAAVFPHVARLHAFRTGVCTDCIRHFLRLLEIGRQTTSDARHSASLVWNRRWLYLFEAPSHVRWVSSLPLHPAAHFYLRRVCFRKNLCAGKVFLAEDCHCTCNINVRYFADRSTSPLPVCILQSVHRRSWRSVPKLRNRILADLLPRSRSRLESARRTRHPALRPA